MQQRSPRPRLKIRSRIVPLLMTATCAVGLASCSGGSSGGGGGGPVTCTTAGAFCLQTCNLGCGPSGGCSLNEIALNQPLQFVFSQSVDPRTVDLTTLSLKTRTGLEPTGEWFADGQTVSFLPQVQTIQGQTFFGFTPNEEYVLTILGADRSTNTVRSTSGDQLAESFTCSLRTTLGIVDLDQAPPQATLISPSVTTDVPRDLNIVLEFSEFIDGSPFFEPLPGEEPVTFSLQEVQPGTGGQPDSCAGRELKLAGTPRLTNDPVRGRTLLTFRPIDQLPGNRCVRVNVTPRVVDLAGTPAVPATFELFIEASSVQERELVFDLADTNQIDLPRSAGTFENGEARFVELGGDGRHGDLVLSDGTQLAPGRFLFDTDMTVLSAKDSSFLNNQVTVSDGRYYFTNMVVPAGSTLEFRGSKPARVFVRGECDIQGRVLVNGATVERGYNAKASGGSPVMPRLPWPGQPGGVPGAGGGAGGDGAWACDGTGNPNQPMFNNFDGYDGDDVQVPAGHAYAMQTGGTGGSGAPLFPAHGDQSMLVYALFAGTPFAASETAAGGGGGGYYTAGSPGRVQRAGSLSISMPGGNFNMAEMGPPGAAGVAFPVLPRPAGEPSSEHFLVGGSGGGGGASHPLFAAFQPGDDPIKYRSGGAGAGGGGALGLRVGSDFVIGASGALEARGGTAEPVTNSDQVAQRGMPAPGGAGSGGSVVLQVSGDVQQLGTIDVRGGAEPTIEIPTASFFSAATFGGAGGDGFLRFERPADRSPAIGQVGTTMPAATAANVGVLQEDDDRVGFMSRYQGTGELFPPRFVRYEITARVDGVHMVFSDDPNVGTPALEGTSPLIFWVQGIDVDSVTGQPVDGAEPGPWRRYVGDFGGAAEGGVYLDGRNGLRWTLIQDRTITTDVVVEEVRIVYQS